MKFIYLQTTYEQELDTWKELHATRKEVRHRHKKHQKDMEKGLGSVDADQFAKVGQSGILRDKTVNDEFVYIPIRITKFLDIFGWKFSTMNVCTTQSRFCESS